MSYVKLDEVVIGSIVGRDLYKDKLLICKEGTPITKRLLDILSNYGFNEICINNLYNDKIDNIVKDFNNMNELIRISLKFLDIDKAILCAKSLIKNLLDCQDNDLMNSMYQYDVDTFNHSKNVAVLSLTVGFKLGLQKQSLWNLAMGALLHDIGKLAISKDIICKTDKLTDAEYEVIKTHPTLGYKIYMSSNNSSSPIGEIIYQHHENYDGSGYPRNLYGIESWRLARIVHICDVYEALCANRSYKTPMSRIDVRRFINSNKVKMFDPILVKVFLNTVPAYFVGEEVNSDGKIAIVLENDDNGNPLLLYDNSHIRLKDFECYTNKQINPETINLLC